MKKLPILFSAALFLLGFSGAVALGSNGSTTRHEAKVAPLVGLDAQGAVHELEHEGNLPDVDDRDDTTPTTTPTTTDATTTCEQDADDQGDDADEVESPAVADDDDAEECEPAATPGHEGQDEHGGENRGPGDDQTTSGDEHSGSGHDGDGGHDGGGDDD